MRYYYESVDFGLGMGDEVAESLPLMWRLGADFMILRSVVGLRDGVPIT
jgi:hypothetical protein